MIRLIADFVMTTSLSATYSDSRSPWRHTCAAGITRSAITSPPARKASSAGKSSSLVSAVRKPRPPRFTPSIGTPRSPTRRAMDSSVPSPPSTSSRSTCPGRSGLRAVAAGMSGQSPAVSFSRTGWSPRSAHQRSSRSTTSRASARSVLATTPIRFMRESASHGLGGFRRSGDKRVEVWDGAARASQVKEELTVALGSLERRRRDAPDVPAAQHAEAGDAGDDRPVVGGVPYHATLADQSLADLELRLDQRHRLPVVGQHPEDGGQNLLDRKSTRLNSSHVKISYAVFCLKKKK